MAGAVLRIGGGRCGASGPSSLFFSNRLFNQSRASPVSLLYTFGEKNESIGPRRPDRSGFGARYSPVSIGARRAGAGGPEGKARLRNNREDSGRRTEPFAGDESYQLAV